MVMPLHRANRLAPRIAARAKSLDFSNDGVATNGRRFVRSRARAAHKTFLFLRRTPSCRRSAGDLDHAAEPGTFVPKPFQTPFQTPVQRWFQTPFQRLAAP